MQRLVKPSDYVLQDVLGQSMYQIPWEPRLCPGNPAEDPEAGALLYNAFVQDQAKGVVASQLKLCQQLLESGAFRQQIPQEALDIQWGRRCFQGQMG